MITRTERDPVCTPCVKRGNCPDVAHDYLLGHIKHGKAPDHLKVLFGFETPQEASSALAGLEDQREMCKSLPPDMRGDFNITRVQIGRLATPPDPEL